MNANVLFTGAVTGFARDAEFHNAAELHVEIRIEVALAPDGMAVNATVVPHNVRRWCIRWLQKA